MQFSIKSFSECERFLEAIACYVLLSNNDDVNNIISYLFYNQTDKNGACICKKWVKLSKFIYEVLKLALCANLNKWYWSHFVIFSFQPIFSPPWPEDSPEESESIVGKEKQKVKVSSYEAKKKGHLQLQEDIFIQLEPFQEATEMIQVLLLLPQWTAKLHLALLDWSDLNTQKIVRATTKCSCLIVWSLRIFTLCSFVESCSRSITRVFSPFKRTPW